MERGGQAQALRARSRGIGKRLPDDIVAFLETDPGLEFLGYSPEDQVVGDLYLREENGRSVTFAELSPLDRSELLFDLSQLF